MYRGDLLEWLLLGAASLSVLIPAILGRRRATAPVSLGALFGYSMFVVWVSARSGDVPGSVLSLWTDAAHSSAPRLLTALVPVEPQPDTVLMPVVVTWLVGLVATEAGLRAGRRLLSYLPPTALYAASLVFVGPQSRPSPTNALVFGAIALAGLTTIRRRDTVGMPGPASDGTGDQPSWMAAAEHDAGQPRRYRRGSRHNADPARPGHRQRRAGTLPGWRSAGRRISGQPAGAGPAVRVAAGAASRFLATAAGCLALAALLGPAVANLRPVRPADPRRPPPPPVVDALDENPLVRLSGWSLEPDRHLLDADIAGPPGSEVLLRLAVLTDYDGVTWRGGGEYRPAGQALPAPTEAAVTAIDSGSPAGTTAAASPDRSRNSAGDSGSPTAPGNSAGDSGSPTAPGNSAGDSGSAAAPGHTTGDTGSAAAAGPAAAPDGGYAGRAGAGATARLDQKLLSQRITIADLDGRLLPAAASPRGLHGIRVGLDTTGGSLLAMTPLRPGLTYTVTSRGRTIPAGALGTAEVPGGADAVRYLGLGQGVPDDLAAFAHEVTDGRAGPYERAEALELFLATHYALAGDAPSGHAYPNLRFFLLGSRAAGGQRGTSEQFAASFAVLARALGLPTRVVVGFRAHGGRTVVSGRDAFAWPEVLFRGLGWVPFDPLPRPATAPRPVERDVRPRPVQSVTPPATVPPVASSSPSGPTSRSPRTAAPPGATPIGWVFAPVVPVGLLGAYAGTIVTLRRRLRRQRMDTGSPGQRVLGCWDEVIDALSLLGRPAGPHMSASEVATHAADVGARIGRTWLPVPALDGLAAQVNQARYAATALDEGSAATAQATALRYIDEVRSRLPWWRRVVWSLDPKPLRHGGNRGP